jgi:hypothetical protein
MTGIQFVADDKAHKAAGGHKVAVQIDLKRYGAVLEDSWDGLISAKALLTSPANSSMRGFTSAKPCGGFCPSSR